MLAGMIPCLTSMSCVQRASATVPTSFALSSTSKRPRSAGFIFISFLPIALQHPCLQLLFHKLHQRFPPSELCTRFIVAVPAARFIAIVRDNANNATPTATATVRGRDGKRFARPRLRFRTNAQMIRERSTASPEHTEHQTDVLQVYG